MNSAPSRVDLLYHTLLSSFVLHLVKESCLDTLDLNRHTYIERKKHCMVFITASKRSSRKSPLLSYICGRKEGREGERKKMYKIL